MKKFRQAERKDYKFLIKIWLTHHHRAHNRIIAAKGLKKYPRNGASIIGPKIVGFNLIKFYRKLGICKIHSPVNMTSKTPAQDRLQQNLQQLAESIKDFTNNKIDQLNGTQRRNFKRKIELPLPETRRIKRFKTAQVCESKCGGIEAGLEIPNIFPLKTPAQNRLRLLQQKLNSPNDEPNKLKEESESLKNENGKIQVIRQGFVIGMNENIPRGNTPSDDVRNRVDSDVGTNKLTCNNGIVHIVPDKNVLLHSLACIENHILKGISRCEMVVEKRKFTFFFKIPNVASSSHWS